MRTKDNLEKGWEELKEMEPGAILKDWYDEGVRCVIMRGPGALCAYLGVPKDHPLAGFDYDDVNIECHGGLTFAGVGGSFLPESFYWYGWDYGHAGDYCFYNDLPPLSVRDRSNEKKWLTSDVEADISDSIYAFCKLIKLSERIAEKARREGEVKLSNSEAAA